MAQVNIHGQIKLTIKVILKMVLEKALENGIKVFKLFTKDFFQMI
jgi:hypothetical protein